MSDPAARHLVFVLAKTPAKVLGLTGPEKAVLMGFVDCHNGRRNGAEVWPSVATIATRTGFNEKTVRAAKRRLHELGWLRIYTDSGKTDLCAINVEALRVAGDPYQKRQGSESGPLPNPAGDPSQIRQGTPPRSGRRMTKEPPSELQTSLTFGHSTNLKVSAGDQQRKMAFLGMVDEAVERMRPDSQEWPTVKKTGGEVA